MTSQSFGSVLATRLIVLATGLALVASAGCSSSPSFAKVQGQVVLANGAKGSKLRIEFHPDESKGTKGPSSFADTDDEGRFTLTYAFGDKTGNGAAVGWHKVVIQDLRLAESETGRGIPIRVSPEMGTVLTTKLEQEVKPGDQEITINVPKP